MTPLIFVRTAARIMLRPWLAALKSNMKKSIDHFLVFMEYFGIEHIMYMESETMRP
jgi:hypothetical protein